MIRLRRILAALLRRRRFEREMAAELDFHVRQHADELLREGATPDEARRRANIAFGGVESVREACRSARGLAIFDHLGRDVRTATRRLWRHPLFAATAVLTLALGLGASLLTFAAVDGLFWRPLPFDRDDELAWIFADAGDSAPLDVVPADVADRLVRTSSPFRVTAAIGDAAQVRAVGNHHQRWRGIWTTVSLFEVLQVTPALGRVPAELPGDGAPRALFISHERWRTDFDGDPSIVGRIIDFEDRNRFAIAGVLPPRLEFPYARVPLKGHGAGFRTGVQDFWILSPDRPGAHPGGVMIGRLAEGVTVGGAASAVADLPSAIAPPGASAAARRLTVIGLREHALGLLQPMLPLVQAFSLLLLLIAGANVAMFFLARAAAATDEVATRVALGASTSDLLRASLVEGSIVSFVGASAAVAVAATGCAAIAATAPSHAALVERISINGVVLAVATTAAIAIAVVVGAISAFGHRVIPLGSGSRRTTPGTNRRLTWLVAGQIALSTVLLVGALDLRTSLHRLMTVDAGYDARGVITANTVLYVPVAEAQPVLRTVAARLASLPGVRAVGFVHSTPLTGKWEIRDRFEVLDGPRQGWTAEMPGAFVGGDYFAAMATPILAGRTFSLAELSTRDFPVVINDLAAEKYFPGLNPVGQRVRMTNRVREIVGVVKATRDVRLDAAPEPQWYQPGFSGSSEIVVRVDGEAAALVPSVRQTIESVDPRFVIQRVAPLESIVAATVIERRLAANLVSFFAVVAMVLAAAGLYGVLHFGVARRRRELGVRAALGATRAALAGLIATQAARLTVAGLAGGTLICTALAPLLQHLLFETPPLEIASLGAAAAILGGVAAAAILRPAWSAASVDPVRTLNASD